MDLQACGDRNSLDGASASPHPGAQSLQLQHSLNRERQVNKLVNNASKPPIQIEVNNSDSNVNIDCSPGFYDIIVRPSILTISKGFQIVCKNTTFELTSITPHEDLVGNVQSTVLKFIYTLDLMEHGLTLSLHHTTQRVQVQGGSKMSDGSKAAIFFFQHFLSDHLKSRAATHKESIEEFNSALLDLAKNRAEQGSNDYNQIQSSICAVCNRDLSKGNSKPVPCIQENCFAEMHTKCFRRHSCPPKECQAPSRKRPIGMTSFLSVEQDEESHPYDLSTSSAKSTNIDEAPSLQVFTATNLNTSTSTTVSVSGPITSIIEPLPVSSEAYYLPLVATSTCSNSSRGKQKTKTATHSPETVKIEFLNKELIIAQTRIKALESEIKRKEETCKIQEERIKSLEHPAVNNLLNHYLTQMEPNAVPPSSDSTCSCSCSSAITEITSELAYIKGQIASLGQCPPLPESTIHNQNPQNLDGIVEVVDLTQQDTATDTPAVDQKSKKDVLPSNDLRRDDKRKSRPQIIHNKRSSSSRTPNNRSRNKKTSNNPQKPVITVQPWMSSSVWQDNAPTLTINPFKNNSSSNHSHSSSHNTRKRRSLVQSRGEQSNDPQSSRLLGGSCNPGPVASTVRNVWATKQYSGTVSNQHRSPPNARPLAEEVRSSWINRFPSSTNGSLN